MVDGGVLSVQGDYTAIKHGYLSTLKFGDKVVKVGGDYINNIEFQSFLLGGGNAFSNGLFCPFHITPVGTSDTSDIGSGIIDYLLCHLFR